MSIIDDFADIAKRMKGELAPKPRVEEEPDNPAPTLAEMISAGNVGCPPAPCPPPMARPPHTYTCIPCLGSGIDPRPIGGSCPDCLGRGWTHTP